MESTESWGPLRVSDGFERPGPDAKRRGRGHLGCDFMYRRPHKGPWDRPEKTPWFQSPSWMVWALACVDGTVIRIVRDKRQGGAVYIRHGRYMSVYRHLELESLLVYKGQVLKAGARLGIVGHAPKAGSKGINHLHFEIWDSQRPGGKWSRARKAIDPKPMLTYWTQIEALPSPLVLC